MRRFACYTCLFSTIVAFVIGQPRGPKSLEYYDYAPIPYSYPSYGEVDSLHNDYMTIDENDLSRTTPKRKRPYNSPIYYIRLPPHPYMYVPGLGYISQPPAQPPMHQLLNLPVNFVANGKPSTIYQWSPGGAELAKPTQPPKLTEVDSTVHKLPGQFTFNGKPDNVFVLRDSYNSLYGDALQNFYP